MEKVKAMKELLKEHANKTNSDTDNSKTVQRDAYNDDTDLHRNELRVDEETDSELSRTEDSSEVHVDAKNNADK